MVLAANKRENYHVTIKWLIALFHSFFRFRSFCFVIDWRACKCLSQSGALASHFDSLLSAASARMHSQSERWTIEFDFSKSLILFARHFCAACFARWSTAIRRWDITRKLQVVIPNTKSSDRFNSIPNRNTKMGTKTKTEPKSVFRGAISRVHNFRLFVSLSWLLMSMLIEEWLRQGQMLLARMWPPVKRNGKTVRGEKWNHENIIPNHIK